MHTGNRQEDTRGVLVTADTRGVLVTAEMVTEGSCTSRPCSWTFIDKIRTCCNQPIFKESIGVGQDSRETR